jgi:polysaccharide export outer membrane protein
MVRFVLIILVFSFIAGCSFLPGLQMEKSQFEYIDEVQEEPLLIPLRLITPDVITSQFKSDASFSTTGKQDYVLGQQRYRYRVGPQDVLSVIVWEHPELTIPAGGRRSAAVDGHRVSADGTIFYPYVGTVFVAGKTVDEIREVLTEKLSKYIKDPQLGVSIVVFDSKKVFVLGEVNKSLSIPITNSLLSLAHVLTVAGIRQGAADPEGIFVLRLEQGKPVAYLLDASEPASILIATAFQMKPQDVVFVSTADIARWGRVLNQILPTLTSYWLIDDRN